VSEEGSGATVTGIGETLRQARISLGLDLEHAAEATNIRARYLDDLEGERFERLPAPVYTRSFLREYADLLGLDAELLVTWYDDEHRELVRPEIVARPTTTRRRPLFPGRGPIVVTAIGLAVIGVWAVGRSSDQSHVATPRVAALPPPPAQRSHPAPVTHHPARVAVVRASRGDCWISVRIGSRAGTVLREGMLAEGQTIRLGLQRTLWVRLGAPWNVVLSVAGRRVEPAHTTRPVNVLLSRSGVAAT
jgi:cytoskeleton protein RodZ